VIERLPKPVHASVRRALRQAWELDDAAKTERLLRNLARRLDQEAPGVAVTVRIVFIFSIPYCARVIVACPNPPPPPA
jgi:hypothetical protein